MKPKAHNCFGTNMQFNQLTEARRFVLNKAERSNSPRAISLCRLRAWPSHFRAPRFNSLDGPPSFRLP